MTPANYRPWLLRASAEPPRTALRAGDLAARFRPICDRGLRLLDLGLAVLRAVALTAKSKLAFVRCGLPRLRDWDR